MTKLFEVLRCYENEVTRNPLTNLIANHSNELMDTDVAQQLAFLLDFVTSKTSESRLCDDTMYVKCLGLNYTLLDVDVKTGDCMVTGSLTGDGVLQFYKDYVSLRMGDEIVFVVPTEKR